jgi:hypothetical protein
MFVLFDKDYFYIQKPPFGWHVLLSNPQARAGHGGQTKIPNSIRKVRRNMSNVFIINPQVVFTINNR